MALIAHEYVRLVLGMGHHYVDAYYGPADLKVEAERSCGTPDRPDTRWQEFERLLSSPRLPSGLR
jgi:hypothetical protein